MRLLLAFFIIPIFIGCKSGTINTDSAENSLFQLPDSLFPLHDIKNSLFFREKSDKDLFLELDSIQKRKLIASIIKSDNDLVSMQYMQVYFVAKQKKIYDFMPIILQAEADDYSALFYILLDKNSNPVSYYRMSGGLCTGPDDHDTVVKYCPVRQSFLNGNEIKSYSITEFYIPDSIIHPAIFDSISYLSKILPSGQIETKKIDSIRYTKMPK